MTSVENHHLPKPRQEAMFKWQVASKVETISVSARAGTTAGENRGDDDLGSPETLAALVLLSSAEPDLSLSPHQLDTAPLPHLGPDSAVVPEAAPEPLMMAQQVPHQTPDRRRVKVYELRHNDWFDRGTGFCYACWIAKRVNRKSPT
ncbi:uncharacterized protein P884DRAFT_301482 [Thermothelomyces heterothallicus CBS 202.75]|uniref:uncharacterized protein n=1 Tax=Thermothelomyces heterothallicus CBS 202.75 TaxID=1149848 RepID=UPI003742542D